jgi:hypothetical protein
MIDKLPGGNVYDGFAYDVGVLQYFTGDRRSPGGLQSHRGSGRHARRVNGTGSVTVARGSFRGSLRGSFKGKTFFQRRPSGNGSNQDGSGALSRLSQVITGDFSNSGRNRPALKRSLSR